MTGAVNAFANPNYDYYKLTKDIGVLKKGTIFFHDPDDHVYGSISNGCLKNCWTPTGGCYGGIIGGSVIFHYVFAQSDLFEKVERNPQNLAEGLNEGTYTMIVRPDGSWSIYKEMHFE